ncbi:MAG: beta-ketoacyl-[acyl-carrier-protein] synthase family protein [Bacteroidales bacterium]|jgi:3-oxoacyl-[acyl-carrier-protein] synthase-1|nr:beta-ketoacyl-[acyl-carrier-protein] synthase family protein [Bacteroidales bacterium]
MSRKVYITGLGIVSSIGMNIDETLESLLTKKSGIKKPKHLTSVHKNDFVLGEIDVTIDDLKNRLNIPENKAYSRTSMLGMIAAREAIKNAGIDNINEFKTGLLSASTVGGMDRSELYYRDFLTNDTQNKYIDIHHCGDNTEKIARDLGIKDFTSTISTACSSSINTIMFGARLIKMGILDRVIAGGVDALSKFTLNGFNTLMILDKEHCRPFDETRVGLNLGEGAGFVVIEADDIVNKSGKKPVCEVSGYANANDAYHQTASSPDGNGAFMAMTNALKISGLSAEDINYVNVHGTGTNNNDLSEGIALKRLFGDNVPPFSSTKGYTGHTLGAAGAIETIFSALAIQNQVTYPNLNFKNTITDLGISPQTDVMKNTEVKHVLSNSFGFGGNNSTIILSKINDN